MKKFLTALLVLIALAVIIPSLADASNWTKYQEPETCWTCGGSGHCSSCDGSGYVEEYGSNDEVECSECNGTGHCSTCGGTGEV